MEAEKSGQCRSPFRTAFQVPGCATLVLAKTHETRLAAGVVPADGEIPSQAELAPADVVAEEEDEAVPAAAGVGAPSAVKSTPRPCKC